MPLKGTVRFEGKLFKTKATTDDATVLVLKNGVPVFQQVIAAAAVDPNGIPLTGVFPVDAPTDTSKDKVEVRIAVDSPIDVTALRLDHKLYYIQADPVDGQQIPLTGQDGSPTLVLQIPADTDIYPSNTLTLPRQPWVSNISGAVTARASLNVGPNSGGGDVFVTVKNAAGLVAKGKITVPNSSSQQLVSTDFPIITCQRSQLLVRFHHP